MWSRSFAPPLSLDSMGKRKSAKKPTAARSLMPLDKYFRCVFCQHERTVTAKLYVLPLFLLARLVDAELAGT